MSSEAKLPSRVVNSEEFIDERLGNIKEIYDELDGTNKLDPQTKKS